MDIDRPTPRWGNKSSSDENMHTSNNRRKAVPAGMLKGLSISASRPHNHSQRSPSKQQEEKKPLKSSIISVLRDPQMPHLLIGYVQLLFNMSLAFILLYIIGGFIHTVRSDISAKTTVHRQRLALEIEACQKAYMENKCMPSMRVPALEQKCREWEACMSRNMKDVGGGRVLAETVADIVNGLLEPIAIKSLVFIAIALFGSVFLSNYAFGLARNRTRPHDAPATVHISYPDPLRMIDYKHHAQ